MYAVVVPGFSCIYNNWSDVERIKAIYPYPKWAKFTDIEAANNWIKRNSYGKYLKGIYNYGDTSDTLYLDAKYKIGDNVIYYVIDCSRVGRLRVNSEEAVVEYKGSKVYMKIPNIRLSNESLTGHMSSIYNLLDIVGDYLDINIELPYYGIFYALTSYNKGGNRYVSLVRSKIQDRLGAVAFSLQSFNK